MIKPKIRLKTIWGFMKPFRLSFLNLFLCVLAASFLGMLSPYLFGLLIDEVFYRQNRSVFIVIVALYFVFYLTEQLLHLVLNATWAYLTTRFSYTVKRAVFKKILSLKASSLTSARTGDFMTIANQDSGQIMEYIHWNVFYLTANIVRLISAIIIVAYINIGMAVLMLVLIPALVYSSGFFSKRLKKIREESRSRYGEYISWVYEMAKGLREIKLMAAQRNVLSWFAESLKKIIRLNIRAGYIEFGSNAANQGLTEVFHIIVYIISALLISGGKLSVGGFASVFEYFYIAKALFENLNQKHMSIQNDMVKIDRVLSLLNEDGEDIDSNNNHKIKPPININRGKIIFEGVEFGYSGSNILKNVNLRICANEKVSLVGKSGAGKSTMANLLMGFYVPSDGRITVDDQDLSGCSVKSLREHIGIVNQDALIMDGTIRDNLLLGKASASEEEMWYGLKCANIDEEIQKLPAKLDTLLGQGGRSMSGGQLQRIAIARIFLRNPKIIIFDEATSTLDAESENAVRQSWDKLSTGRTTIIIAHRLRTIIDSDKIAVLSNGQISGLGSHMELIENCEEYKELFDAFDKNNENGVAVL